MSFPQRPPLGMPPMAPGMGYAFATPMGMMPMSMGVMQPTTVMRPLVTSQANLTPQSLKPSKKQLVPQEIPKDDDEEKPPVTTVFVGNFSDRAPDAMVRQMLQRCGNVLSWKRVQGASGKLQAFGFCKYENPEATLRCMRLLNEWEITDKKLVVKVDAKTKTLLDEYRTKKKAKLSAMKEKTATEEKTKTSENGDDDKEDGDKEKEEKDKSSENGDEKDDDLDEFSKREDRVAKAGLDAIMREYASDLSKPVSSGMMPMSMGVMQPTTVMRPLVTSQANLTPQSLKPSKKQLVPQEIPKDDDEEKPPVTTVFVGNFSDRAPDAMVRQMLQRCGNVLSWKRVQGASGKLQAFGFCKYENPEATLRCMRLLNEWEITDKKLVVKVDAKTKTLLDEYRTKKKAKLSAMKEKTATEEKTKTSENGDDDKEDGDKEKEEKDKSSENGDEKDDDLDEFSKREDRVAKAGLDAIMREYASDLSKPVPSGMMPMSMGVMQPTTVMRPLVTSQANLTPQSLKPSKKQLVPQEIPKDDDEEKPPVTTVFVGNFSDRAPDAMVRQMLQRCGNVLSWKRVQGASGKLQAFGFCKYENPEATLRCMRLLNEWEITDKKLVVKVDAKTKTLLDEYRTKKKAKLSAMKEKTATEEKTKTSENGDDDKEDGDKEKEEKDKSSENGDEKDDDLDEFSKREDRVAKAGLDAIMREYASDLSKPVPSGRKYSKVSLAGT